MTTSINLVPGRFRRRLLVRRQVRKWCVVWILAGSAAASACLAQYGWVASRQRTLASLETRCRPLRVAEESIDRMQQRLDELNDRESLLASLKRADHPAQLVGIVGRAARRHDAIHVGTFELTTTREPGTTEVVDERGQTKTLATVVERTQLSLHGLGTDDLAVAQFVADLRQAGIFDQVSLKSSVKAPGLPENIRRFHVDCSYQ